MDKIEFSMGEYTNDGYPILVTVVVKKTWYNRLRFWLFFKFFPFEFRRWLKMDPTETYNKIWGGNEWVN